MSTRILLVRAVNVGGASLPMAQFRELLAALGGRNVRTYIASGNAVCDVEGDAAAFDRELEMSIEARFGFFREVMSRTAEEVRAAFAGHPFEVIDPAFSYVSFLSSAPTDAAIAAASELPTGADEWRVIGRELHIRYENGAGRPTMNVDALGRRLGVAMTARNLRTVQALIALAG